MDLFREQPFLFAVPMQLLQRQLMCLPNPEQRIPQFLHLTLQVVDTWIIQFLSFKRESIFTQTTK